MDADGRLGDPKLGDRRPSWLFMNLDPNVSDETADELPPLSVAPGSRRLKLRSGAWWLVALAAAVLIVAAAIVR